MRVRNNIQSEKRERHGEADKRVESEERDERGKRGEGGKRGERDERGDRVVIARRLLPFSLTYKVQILSD